LKIIEKIDKEFPRSPRAHPKVSTCMCTCMCTCTCMCMCMCMCTFLFHDFCSPLFVHHKMTFEHTRERKNIVRANAVGPCLIFLGKNNTMNINNFLKQVYIFFLCLFWKSHYKTCFPVLFWKQWEMYGFFVLVETAKFANFWKMKKL